MNPLLHPRVHRKRVRYQPLTGALFVDRATGLPAEGEDRVAEAIRATEIRQGELGNCHFLAAVGAVARRKPELLASRFVAADEEGCTVRLFRTAWGAALGPLRSVPLVRELGPAPARTGDLRLRFEFPVFEDSGLPAFVRPYVAKSGLRELWLLALEKAYARYHTAYFLAQAGFGANALGLLTGRTVRLVSPLAIDAEHLRRSLAEGEIVLATTWPNLLLGGRFALPADDPRRLSPVHVYEVLATSAEGFVLRNPHGPELDVEVSFGELRRHFLSLAICRL